MGTQSSMRTAALASTLVIWITLLGLPALVFAQEPTIPRVEPRPADTLVMLPDGATVHVELAKTDAERSFGLMERNALPEGRGMLFIHDEPRAYPYWIYHCKIALDIVWMDPAHRVVEVSADTPPCRGKANTCPNYGGHAESEYVLELPAGSAKKHGIRRGEVIHFGL